jgi:hypothetical protein
MTFGSVWRAGETQRRSTSQHIVVVETDELASMSTTICFATKNIYYPKGGGHFWVSLNWALGLRALGCEVVWLEFIDPRTPIAELKALTAMLKNRLEPYGLHNAVALSSAADEALDPAAVAGCLDVRDAAERAMLLVNLCYNLPAEQVHRFRRSVLLDIDPGLLQMWITVGRCSLVQHDLYFTIGETVGTSAALFPSCGVEWHYTPPPVFLPAWPPTSALPDAAYTTVGHWWGERIQFGDLLISEEKRDSFLEYRELPLLVGLPLELALTLGDAAEREQKFWGGHGWRIRDSHAITDTPARYRSYIQRSRGEFSCAKPSCMLLQNAWISDRTICYLASGKPAIVQHTGPSRFLPDAEGLFRFRNIDEAVRAISLVEADYERQCRTARALAEEYFSAEKVIGRFLERALI